MKITAQAKRDAFYRIQVNFLEKAKEENFVKFNKLESEQFTYSFFMYLRNCSVQDCEDEEDVDMYLSAYQNAINIIGLLTPKQFERMFPIKKEYNGERWQMKDYFSCKKELNSLPQNESILKNKGMFDFLWGYHNEDICSFMVDYMEVIDVVRKFQGQPSIIEEFLGNQGVPVYRKFKGNNGEEYLQNSKAGKVQLLKQPLPQYIKVVK